MKRRSWLTWLFGGGSLLAQEKFQTLCKVNGQPSFCDIKNNQCPVCGTMSPPTGKRFNIPVMSSCEKFDNRSGECSPPVMIFGYGILERCRNCNTAFWKDTPMSVVNEGAK